jgi:hypothetical protein
MTVRLRVEECTSFRTFPFVREFEGPTRQAAIAGFISEGDSRFDPSAIISLLSRHDDIRIGGPTWDVRFTQTFIPE